MYKSSGFEGSKAFNFFYSLNGTKISFLCFVKKIIFLLLVLYYVTQSNLPASIRSSFDAIHHNSQIFSSYWIHVSKKDSEKRLNTLKAYKLVLFWNSFLLAKKKCIKVFSAYLYTVWKLSVDKTNELYSGRLPKQKICVEK